MAADKRRYMLSGLIWGAASAACFGAAFAPLNWFPLVLLGPVLIAMGCAKTFGARGGSDPKDSRPSARVSTGEIRPGRMPPIQMQTGGTPVTPIKRSALKFALGIGAAWAVLWGLLHLWLVNVSALGLPILALHLAMYPALFAWVLARLVMRWSSNAAWFGLPFVWPALEVLRGEVLFHGYPWYLVAHPLVETLLSRGPTMLGVYFTGYFAIGPAMLLADINKNASIERKWVFSLLRAVLLGCILAFLFISPSMLWHPALLPDGPSTEPVLRIAAVQTNVRTNNHSAWTGTERLTDFRRMIELTREAARGQDGIAPDLIVWPETMVPTFYGLNAEAVAVERAAQRGFTVKLEDGTEEQFPSTIFHDALCELQGEIGIPMIVGDDSVEGLEIDVNPDGSTKDVRWKARYNSAHLILNGAVQPTRYDKMHLTPFGETLPYLGGVKPVRDWMVNNIAAAGMLFDLTPGTAPTILEVPLRDPATRGLGLRPGDPPPANRIGPPVVRIATPICFEATMPGVCRELVVGPDDSRRADVMINLTNDGWFGDFDANRQHHLQASRWRCIELGTPMVRAANTGISVGIDRFGRIIEPGVGARRDGVVFVDVPLTPGAGTTPAIVVGDMSNWVLLAFGALPVVLALWPRRKTPAAG